ncbi:DctP family TRAP transporter solute-binding subunit [Gemmiger sp.]|uniref:DctP family TRAP transporter solute-binding subunit n=1 Tax=Gemmiger sp. TaxID=2049027 RepID=UPI00352077DB
MKKALKVLSTVMAAGMLAACGSTAASSTATSATSTAESTAASSDEAVTLRLGHTQPTDHQVNITAERFAELVNEYSGGSVTVEVYPNSTFGSASEMNAAVQSGDLDLYVNASAQFASQYEPMTVVDAWYMFNDTDHLMKFYSPDCEVYQTLCEGLKEACNIDSLAPIYYGARHMTANTSLNSVSDLKGLKMRVASDPMPTAFFEAMGATPTPVAYNETYLALQQNVADGEENPAASITSMKFYEVQKTLNLTAHQYQMLTIYMSVPSEEKLSDAQMEAVRKAAAQAAEEHNAVAFDQEQEIIDALKDKIEVVTPSDLDSFKEACAAVYPQYEETWGAGVADAIKALA